MKEEINRVFEQRFGKASLLVKSPGRVNLIGEHTDYNDGFVLPAAVDLSTWFACAPNKGDKFRFYSANFNDYFETPVNEIAKCDKKWINYLLGVIAQFVSQGKSVHGFDCVFGGNLPMGVGMSSSASIETGLAFAINQMEDYGYSTLDLVKFSQQAEHEYAGVQCGIMDQFAVMHGHARQVIKLDCRSLDYELFPFEMEDQMLILINTGVNHSLVTSAYNKRRKQCEAGVSFLQKFVPEINSLRDVPLKLIQSHKDVFDPVIYDRCEYVIEENIRVEKACNALVKDDFGLFGEQMFASHEGLKNLFQVSCPELDRLVYLAKSVDGVLGARMMGGGFGGCTINLVKKNSIENFEKIIREHYKTPEGNSPEIIKTAIGEGTHVVFL